MTYLTQDAATDVGEAPGGATVPKSKERDKLGAVSSTKRSDMTWYDHLVMLLHIGAEIEHALMVQYLYAAYSIGGAQIPVEHRRQVESWRDSIISVAKEEMGHLLTVQNLLTLLGAPINLNRDNFPWDIEYYPFPFRLEPFSVDSLSCYIYAEMPGVAEGPRTPGKRKSKRFLDIRSEKIAKGLDPAVERQRIVDDVIDRVHARYALPGQTPHLHRVGDLYGQVIDILSDPARIPDSMFSHESFTQQASWEDWGRGYKPDPRSLDAAGNLKPAALKPAAVRQAHVLIDRAATRSQAIAALRALSEQGEVPHLGANDTGEPSHFDRFVEIYAEIEELGPAWSISRPVPVNPTLGANGADHDQSSLITARSARQWAQLFNLRYRIMLSFLAHTFSLARTTPHDKPSVRAMLMHRVFGEMYNLKTIAAILVQIPRCDPPYAKPGEDGSCAGPPFEMPYSLNLPQADVDVWRRHRDLLGSSCRLSQSMLDDTDPTCRKDFEAFDGPAYIHTLLQIDHQALHWIETILAAQA